MFSAAWWKPPFAVDFLSVCISLPMLLTPLILIPEMDAPAAPKELLMVDCLLDSAPDTIAPKPWQEWFTCSWERIEWIEYTPVSLTLSVATAVDCHHTRNCEDLLLVKERNRRLLNLVLPAWGCIFDVVVARAECALVCYQLNFFAIYGSICITVEVCRERLLSKDILGVKGDSPWRIAHIAAAISSTACSDDSPCPTCRLDQRVCRREKSWYKVWCESV